MVPVLNYDDLKFLDFLGRGAYGTVKRALYERSGETVAVKQVRFGALDTLDHSNTYTLNCCI